MGENIVAKSEKDEFNFDDFQYSGVKIAPVPDLTQEVPEAEAATPAPEIAEAAAPVVEEAAPLEAVEPADKKSKKKAKKEKPVKVKKEKVAVVVPAGEKRESAFLKKLSEASPYTVLLGMTVVALLIAVVLLLSEMGGYDFNIHPPKSL
jgi:hypothetical protein